MREPLDVEDLFYVLGNPTRRLLLKLLSMGPHYPFQLARLLNISQKAVMDHLKVLEERGIVVKLGCEKSTIGPERTYYGINSFLMVDFSVAPSLYELKVVEAKRKEEEVEAVTGAFGELASKLKDLVRELEEVEKKLRDLERQRVMVLDVKQRISIRISELINLLGLDYFERIILNLLIMKGGARLEEISEELDLREKTVEKCLERLKERNLVEERNGVYKVIS
ncbi:MAG: helix-turn-helix domain-containing protein [Candidatus Freyarchaeota archaeon]|nr:helix-turn-helix domain-containing protein [Candidatus Jordarchaeia archaeon]